ncbi:collagenase-like [Wyeomyia smithii]|uniref:collagenase-like n=1 Tax=Wyeomyia smithii TaxID=174621 RepID=UPI0024680ADA|nr:collagenase-like [Wyeomyia smithii]
MKFLVVLALLVAVASATITVDRTQRVIGGDLATSGQFPYAVGLITRINILLSGQCSGSLLSTRYILTSAACVNNIQSAVAVMGGLRINDSAEPGTIRMTVTEFIVHTGYEEDGENFDVALVVLPSAISFSDNIQPVRLPNRRQVEGSFVGQQATFMGWGRFGEGTANSADLRFGRSQVITNLACIISLPTNTILGEHICTAGMNDAGQGSPCQGDSGAPLTVMGAEGITTQIGVFSFHSILGCDSGRAAVYTRMSSYLDWIEQNSDVEVMDDF